MRSFCSYSSSRSRSKFVDRRKSDLSARSPRGPVLEVALEFMWNRKVFGRRGRLSFSAGGSRLRLLLFSRTGTLLQESLTGVGELVQTSAGQGGHQTIGDHLLIAGVVDLGAIAAGTVAGGLQVRVRGL